MGKSASKLQITGLSNLMSPSIRGLKQWHGIEQLRQNFEGGSTSIRQSGRALAFLRCTLAHIEIYGNQQDIYLKKPVG